MRKAKKGIVLIIMLSILIFTINSQSKSIRWEYDVIVQSSKSTKYELANLLSNKGNYGWELVQILVDNEGNWMMVFKKPI